MKRYILFTEEELTDLGKGTTIECPMPSGEILYFMCVERYEEMLREKEEEE